MAYKINEILLILIHLNNRNWIPNILDMGLCMGSVYMEMLERDLDGGLDPRAHSLTAHSETGREAGEIMRRMQSGSERRLIPQADVHC